MTSTLAKFQRTRPHQRLKVKAVKGTGWRKPRRTVRVTVSPLAAIVGLGTVKIAANVHTNRQARKAHAARKARKAERATSGRRRRDRKGRFR
jgi:hypothetical protein